MKVVCIDNSYNGDLTIGKTYEVCQCVYKEINGIRQEFYQIEVKFDDVYRWPIEHFKTIEEIRDEKLNQIL